MEDLISRNALLKEIDETAEAVEEQNVCADIKKAFLDALATVREHVVNMPTAYNSPICKANVEWKRYCEDCGQAIDWEEFYRERGDENERQN